MRIARLQADTETFPVVHRLFHITSLVSKSRDRTLQRIFRLIGESEYAVRPVDLMDTPAWVPIPKRSAKLINSVRTTPAGKIAGQLSSKGTRQDASKKFCFCQP